MIMLKNSLSIEWLQFLYSSPHNPGREIESELLGTRREGDIEERFLLEKNETLIRVQVKIPSIHLVVGGAPKWVALVRGIPLFTTAGRASPAIQNEGGDMLTEEFDGYTLGYARGRMGLLVDQLQFSWDRTLSQWSP